MNLYINKQLIEQLHILVFNSKIQIDNITGCWNWIGGKHKTGYGSFYINGKYVKTHRFSYIIHNRVELNPYYLVCHKCDNRKCVNPDHLFLGSNLDNNQDMMKKGRHVVLKGEDHKCAILTDDCVKQILINIYNNKYSNVFDIAEDYSVSHHTIHTILDGKRWTHITNQLKVPLKDIKIKVTGASKHGRLHPRSPFESIDQVKNIKQRLLNGESIYDLANEFNVNHLTMYNIKIGRTYKSI